MIKHIVFFKSPESNKDIKLGIIDSLAKSLIALESKIPQIISLEVGINVNKKESAYDLSLHTTFSNLNDLNIYQNHSEHLKVVKEIKENNLQSAVVDYDTNSNHI